MTSVNKGIAFARVTSKCRKGDVWSYSLSNGSAIYVKTDTLKLGQWYFFELKLNAYKQLEYVSHKEVAKQEGDEFALRLKNLQQHADRAVAMWNKSTAAQKAVIAKSLGCGLAGIGAASFAADAAGTLLFEGLGGVLSGGTSLVISGALATISIIQYEEAKAAVSLQTAAIKEYKKAQKAYTKWLNRLCPLAYEELDVIDPEIQSLVLQIKKMIADFEWGDLWSSSDEINLNYAAA